MTARGALILFLIGFAVDIVGALFKIQHWPFAGVLLIAASLFQAIAVVVLIIKISGYPGFKDFLDR